jgi:hypothetical protein
MRIVKDRLWTWLLPDGEREIDMEGWVRNGGKWIVFDHGEAIVALGDSLRPFIDAGEIRSAKYWNGDPSAINVYSLDSERERTWDILKGLGAGNMRVWEYDYAWCRNAMSPVDFLFSWFSKFRTILQSYGFAGTLKLIREVLFEK